MFCYLKRAIAIVLITVVILELLPLNVFGQIREPDSTFVINSAEAYQNILEAGDQLYLVLATVKYTVLPSEAIDSTYSVRLMNGGVEIGATTFYPYKSSGYDYGLAAIYYPAVTAPVWGGAYTIRVEGSPTIQWMDTTAVTAMSSAQAFDSPAYTNETAASNSAAANDMTLLPVLPVAGDAYYFGSDTMFDLLTINVGTNGSWTGTYQWEYYDGATWQPLVGLVDGTTGFEAGAGNLDVSWTCPTNWQQVAVNGITEYYVRFRVVTFTAIVTQPLGTQSWTNSLAVPPVVSTAAINWLVPTDVIAILTNRFRIIGTALETTWGVGYDIVETIASVKKLTVQGEDYFENTVPNIRLMCPDLFASAIGTPEFTEKQVVDDFYESASDVVDDDYGANWFAQTFTATDTYTVAGVNFWCYKTGNPAVITVSLRATAAGLPVAAPELATGTEASTDYTTSTLGNWEEITFTTGYQVTAGTTYAIVIRAPAGGVGNELNLFANSAGTYAGGQSCSSVNSGVNWAAIAGQDYMFFIVGENAYNMSYRERLANILVGTPIDMTLLGTHFGLTRMWMSSIIWILLCMLFAGAMFYKTKEMRSGTITFLVIFPLGAFGFIYLEIAALEIFLSVAIPLFLQFYQRG